MEPKGKGSEGQGNLREQSSDPRSVSTSPRSETLARGSVDVEEDGSTVAHNNYSLKLWRKAMPYHETFKTKFMDETKAQLSSIATHLYHEQAFIQSQLAIKPDPDLNTYDELSPSMLAARVAALEETTHVIRELDDLSHTTVQLYDGSEACPDGQFRHESRVPHFVFEIGYSEEQPERCLRDRARAYIEGTDEIRTIATVKLAYYPEEGCGQAERSHPIDRSATLCLYREERCVIKDAVIRDHHGTGQDGNLVLSLNDFISDDTAEKLEHLYPYRFETTDQIKSIHPSALLIKISFRQLARMLAKGEQHQKTQDTALPPDTRSRPKRKLCFDNVTLEQLR